MPRRLRFKEPMECKQSLLKDFTSDLAQTIAQEKAEAQIREVTYVRSEGGFIQFAADEAYVIARSLKADT